MYCLTFTKMHGIGNDYIYINGFEHQLSNLSDLAVQLSDRHFGIGSDGLVLINPSEKADFQMEMLNSDGSVGLMCGNAIRCVAKYVYERGLTRREKLDIETRSGIRTVKLHVSKGLVDQVEVDMGRPEFRPASIPIRWRDQQMIDEPIAVGGQLYRLTCLSMGNPHAVIFHDRVDQLDLEKMGPLFEHHSLFPDRVNTEFVQVEDRENLRVRVWERGSGETMACGTGACAALVAAVRTGRAQRQAVVHLRGGSLNICWSKESDPVIMRGPATFVFDGHIHIPNQERGQP